MLFINVGCGHEPKLCPVNTLHCYDERSAHLCKQEGQKKTHVYSYTETIQTSEVMYSWALAERGDEEGKDRHRVIHGPLDQGCSSEILVVSATDILKIVN